MRRVRDVQAVQMSETCWHVVHNRHGYIGRVYETYNGFRGEVLVNGNHQYLGVKFWTLRSIVRYIRDDYQRRVQ